jgi:hypothetical protein
MYPNHHIERRHVSTSNWQLAKESHLYQVFFYVNPLFILLVSLELRPLRASCLSPNARWFSMQRCRIKIDRGKLYVPEKSLFHSHVVYQRFHVKNLSSDFATRITVFRCGWQCYCTIRDGMLLHGIIDPLLLMLKIQCVTPMQLQQSAVFAI